MVDPDEVIDVFEQEERNMLGIQEMEAETDSSSDDEEEFLPYDLMETPTVSSILHLDEVASSLSSDDFSKRESSWQSLRELVRSDPCDVTTNPFRSARCARTEWHSGMYGLLEPVERHSFSLRRKTDGSGDGGGVSLRSEE